MPEVRFFHGVLVQMKRLSGNGFRQNADAGVDRRHLHGGTLCDGLARGRAAQEKAVAASRRAVLRLVPCVEQAG